MTATAERLAEPVRRYFAHALPAGEPDARGVRLTMRGRIKVGVWLRFTATWEGDGRSFEWRAKAGPLRVVDRFADGAGSMDVRLFGRIPLVHADDETVARSAAGRAAVEAMWSPVSLLPDRGVAWSVEDPAFIDATWDVPPERPQVRFEIDADGAVQSTNVMRWHRDAYVPCGAIVHAERRFGDLTIPSWITAGWWFGTARWAPFFDAEVISAELVR
jgi:hypothetical protein